MNFNIDRGIRQALENHDDKLAKEIERSWYLNGFPGPLLAQRIIEATGDPKAAENFNELVNTEADYYV